MGKIRISNNWISIEADYLSEYSKLGFLQRSIRLDSICKMECYSDDTFSNETHYRIELYTNHRTSGFLITYYPGQYNLFIEDMKALNSNLHIE